ncbi:MAG TPA: Ppx/GppA phosphatase family protein [Bryobacteraceae bacterium]|nr:Ppx/GppA phosphatase family protein [Bryobacteraceae bacterium]
MPRYAAIDIGSNSIRMETAEVIPGQPTRILASDREVTRLGESVFRNGAVSEEAIQATCVVLSRMAELYRKLEVIGLRAVATSAIRDARNQKAFVERASFAVGAPVEIISGREEARLIHLGVESNWTQNGKRVLLIDIGGGSAEIVAAERGQMLDSFSKPLGAVRLKENFLKQDPPSAQQLRQMHEYIEQKLDGAVRRLGHEKWDRVIATSATASAVANVVAHVPRSQRDEIDRQRITTADVRALYERLSRLGLSGRRKVMGIGPRRAEIIVPGVAVLLDFLQQFQLRALYYSRAGVRDGIIADLAARNVGSELSRLSRDQRREVENMGKRYGVALDHARKVAEIASGLFTSLETLHELTPAQGKLLEAAAYLIDVGHYVSDASHHKHSWYVVANSDLAGFTERERLLIAALCRYHRKSLPNPEHSAYQTLTADEKRTLMLLVPLLRLADNLDRSHDQRVNGVECRLRDGHVVLQVHSQGDIDLEQWAAEQAATAFQQVYQRPIELAKARD